MLALAWICSSLGCLAAVQGILRVVAPRTGPYVARKATHLCAPSKFDHMISLYPFSGHQTALTCLDGANSGDQGQAVAASGTVFMLTWPLYPAPTLLTNLVAASVVGAATLQFVLVGTRVIKDPALVKGLGHGPGRERMLLHGPTQYGVAVSAATAAAFRQPFSVVLISVLCCGDSMAALVGRSVGRIKLPWCPSKVRLHLAPARRCRS